MSPPQQSTLPTTPTPTPTPKTTTTPTPTPSNNQPRRITVDATITKNSRKITHIG